MADRANNNRYLLKSRGFTLFEILIAIAIVAILSTLVMPDFISAFRKTRDARRKSDLRQMQKALELYKSDQTPIGYPPNATYNAIVCGSRWQAAVGGNIYMPKMPCDPKTNSQYYYDQTGSLTYQLTACLENASDPDKDSSLNGGCTIASYTLYEP